MSVYNGGIIEPKKGVRYSHIMVEGTICIDNDAFINIRGELRRVEICEGVKEIGEGAFYGCQDLESIAFRATLTSIKKYAFCYCKTLKRVELCEGLESVGYGAFRECTSLEFVYLSSTVTSMYEGVFRGCKSLKSIEIPQV